MKDVKKVVSKDLGLRMQELGWDHETERYWKTPQKCMKKFYTGFPWLELCKVVNDYTRTNFLYYPAPDATEIGEVLPGKRIYVTNLSGKKEWDDVKTKRWGKTFYCGCSFRAFVSETEAEAKGEMWCYLKENKLI